ncbi:MAG: GspH/FimT family pseudopilin [Gemmatimonadota bacterium]
MRTAESVRLPSGFTLLELMVSLSIAGLLLVIAGGALRSYREAVSLDAAARAVRVQLGRARASAIGRREVVRLRLSPDADLWLLDSSGGLLSTVPLGSGGSFAPDSIRLRPSTLRFNSRGQAAPASIYLYRGKRGVRLVSNFLGRVREERFTL